jgi:UDP-2,3-diacylglucosamine pyrophosphatase LpxH
MSGGRRLPQDVLIISDLHLGGAYGSSAGDRGFRINTHASELAGFLLEVRDRAVRTRRRTELVINGDFVDFLAEGGANETDWRAFIADEDEAVARLDTIVDRDPAVFEALAALLDAEVPITLLLGNHDVELSLPAVRARLRDHMRAGRSAPMSFVYDGEAYVIGDTLIEHGNRYDGFNVVDFDQLRRFRSELSRRLPASPDALFEAPAGSLLVEEVMNPIKQEYGFIDLLKPETEAAIPLLLAIEPSLAKDIAGIERVAQLREAARRRAPIAPARPRMAGNIRAGAAEAGGSERTLKEIVSARLGADNGKRLMALVDEAGALAVRAQQQIRAGPLRRALSFIQMTYFTPEWEARVDLLLEPFLEIQPAVPSDWFSEPEACYREAAAELVKGGFRNVVFGHTHAPKIVDLDGEARYLNSGSWADRLRLPKVMYSADRDNARQILREFAVAIRDNQFQPYVEFAPTFAHVQCDEHGRTAPGAVHTYEPGVVMAL